MSGLFLGNIVFLLFPCGYFTFIFKNHIFHKLPFFSAKITIFQGTFRGMVTNDSESGVPIVLNFTGTDNFLSCTSKGEEKILTVKVSFR